MDAQPYDRYRMYRGRVGAAIFLGIAILLAVPAQATDAGLAWLLSQQQADGRVSAPADETHPHHATHETLLALHLLGLGSTEAFTEALGFVVPNGLENGLENGLGDGLGGLDSGTANGTLELPWQARGLIAQALAGVPVPDPAQRLAPYQVRDGGFASRPATQGSVVDTIAALEVLHQAGIREAAMLGPALDFLRQRQHADGGFAPTANSPRSVYLTARAVAVLERHRFEHGLSATLQGAQDFLWAARHDDLWGAPWETAHAVLALMPVTTDGTRLAETAAALRAQQAPDGSWNASVYATALALQALHRVATPPAPEPGSITGQVIDQASGAALSGVQVSAWSAQERLYSTQSGADGRFGLADLEPDAYTLSYASTGFQGLQQSVELAAGQRLDQGPVELAMVADTALLSGQITDALTGAPVTATVAVREAVSGALLGQMTADPDGRYVLSILAGGLQLSVTATGYSPLNLTATVAAGTRSDFSPGLQPEGTAPEDGVINLSGRVLAADTQMALAGVAVEAYTDGAEDSIVPAVSTDGTGHFTLVDLPVGSMTLHFIQDGYQSVALSLLTGAGGSVDLGDVVLLPAAVATTRVSGVVSDRDTGMPLAGATLFIEGQTRHTDAQGHYEIEGIEVLEFGVTASAIGYRSQTAGVVLQQHGSVQLDIPMVKTAVDGIRLVDVTLDQTAYPAYRDAQLRAQVENTGDQARRVVMTATVLGAANAFREDFVVNVNGDARDGGFVLDPGETRAADFSWFTRNLAPGAYRVIVQVATDDRAALLSEQAVNLEIVPTLGVEWLRVQGQPTALIQGESRTIEILGTVHNGSNVPVALGFDLAVVGPDATVLHQAPIALELSPDTLHPTLHLGSFQHHFVLGGAYRLEIANLTGVAVATVHTVAIDVAPNLRIEAQVELDPERMVPGTNRDVQIRLTLEGMEDAL